MIKRSLFCACKIICAAMISVAVHAQSTTPNVLLIVADDLGVGDLRSFTPQSQSHTPSIDKLAQQGTRFTRFYTESTCSASRVGLLTGQFPARLGFHPVARGISPEVITMADWFREHGYTTHHVGKWHIGELSVLAWPASQGFDTSFGFLNQWFLQGPGVDGTPTLRAPVYQNPWLQDEKGNGKIYEGYLPDILTEHAISKIETLARGSSPWFMLYASPLPHSPIHSPPEIASDGNVTEDEQYQSMLEHLDKNIGQLLAAVEKTGQSDNTIIIFMSDNGAPEKRYMSNGFWGGGKGSYTEGGVRTPLIWVDSARVLAGSMDERAVSIVDIFPTLANRIGFPLTHKVDGLDVNAPENISLIRSRFLYWLSRDGYSIISADSPWRLSQQWVAGHATSLQWQKILNDAVADSTAFQWLYFLKINRLNKQFHDWLETVSMTPVTIHEDSGGGRRISGNDFLRTPLKEWDFYIALKPDQLSGTEQVIADQMAIWSLAYIPAQKSLHLSMHGNTWDVPVQMSGECVLLGINADIYDRYTNLSSDVHPSRLRISINGVSISELNWKIDSLRNVRVDTPTTIGSHKEKQWLSDPVFLHRASAIGEWAFLADEKKLRTDLCAQLGE